MDTDLFDLLDNDTIEREELENALIDFQDSLEEGEDITEFAQIVKDVESLLADTTWDFIIHENHFRDYIKSEFTDLYDDCLKDVPSWIKFNLDYEGCYDDMESDYTLCKIGDVTYYYGD